MTSRQEPQPTAQAGLATDVRRGLTARPKTLPPYLFYDHAGSQLYERITALPEYYLTRVERSILASRAPEIVERASNGSGSLAVIELGAGSASKTELVLCAALERQRRCLYVPVDVSAAALADARRRLLASLVGIEVRALPMTYDQALRVLADVPPPRLVLFIGSSVGNMRDEEAAALLRRVRRALPGDTWLLLGTDLVKSTDALHAAYDDAEGVTAAFNKNLLCRINRELGGQFVLERFRHAARWNARESRIEMHLVSDSAQEVSVDGLALRVRFEAGESIHTESSIKYDLPRVARLLSAGDFGLEATYLDPDGQFALHLARSS
jgi:dimethylhistidine N-methyltransferase